MEIEVWYGNNWSQPAYGPIEAEYVCSESHEGNEIIRFRITDKDWLEIQGWDEPTEFVYDRLRSDGQVLLDAYAWCPKGEGIVQEVHRL